MITAAKVSDSFFLRAWATVSATLGCGFGPGTPVEARLAVGVRTVLQCSRHGHQYVVRVTHRLCTPTGEQIRPPVPGAASA